MDNYLKNYLKNCDMPRDDEEPLICELGGSRKCKKDITHFCEPNGKSSEKMWDIKEIPSDPSNITEESHRQSGKRQPVDKLVLSESDKEKLADSVEEFWGKIRKIYNKTFKELSKKIDRNPEYITRLKRQILNEELTAIKYFKNLRLWYNILKDGIEPEKETYFIKLYNSHIEQIIPFCKSELLSFFCYYENLVKYNNWSVITTFNDFYQDIINLKVDIISDYPFEIWCGVKGHEKYKKAVYGQNLGQCNYYCHLCMPHGQSIKYNEILILSFSYDYELKKPSSEKDWIKMILLNKLNKVSPSNISIVLACQEHGDFSTTYNRLQQGHRCPNCKLLSIEEIQQRGFEYGLELITPLDQVRSKLQNSQKLQWICISHKEKIESLPYESEMERHYCQKCSKGEMSYERVIRYLLNKMFFNKFGINPVPYEHIDELKFTKLLGNIRIKKFLLKYNIFENNYKSSHFDCFGYVKIDNKILKVVIEVWGPQHKNMKFFLKYYPKRTSFDYKSMKTFENLRKILKVEGFIDIFITLPLYKISRNKYQDFIIKEFKRQLLEFHKIKYNRIFINFSWNNLLKDIRFAKDFQDLRGYLI